MIVVKKKILQSLRELNKLFNGTTKPNEHQYYGKLAIIELCGWIEQTMDEMIRNIGKKCLKENGNLNYLENVVIKKIHGFLYDEHMRKMLIDIIGLVKVELMEKVIDPRIHAAFKGELITLKSKRDQQAHTHISGLTIPIDNPTVTLASLPIVFNGLKNIQACLRKIKI
jgi:hypothetical protein